MGKQWDSKLEIGNKKIDHQHKELFELVSMLDRAIQKDPKTEIPEIILFLEHYVSSHFKDEETYMKRHRYEGYEHHQKEHDKFKEKVVSLRTDYEEGTKDAKLMFSIRKCIDSMVDHILTVDVGLAEFSKGH